jgi:hypothetical protein
VAILAAILSEADYLLQKRRAENSRYLAALYARRLRMLEEAAAAAAARRQGMVVRGIRAAAAVATTVAGALSTLPWRR